MPEDLPSLSPFTAAADSVGGAFPLNRVVVIATPILASSAAVLGGWLVDNLPGRVDAATRRSVMLAASASATVMAYKWLDGWQQHAQQEFEVEHGLIPTESFTVPDASLLAPEAVELELDAEPSG